jgi:hydrogenase nickel incorporation protein HypA/HybF
MHELSLVTEIYRTARRAVESNGGGRIEVVRLAVGELAAVEPDLLSFAWEAVTRDTPDAGARLDVDFRPAKQTCAACGVIPERAAGSWLRLCPRCQGPLGIEGGDELDVLNVTFEEADTEAAGLGSSPS